jgi:hypothetical protein
MPDHEPKHGETAEGVLFIVLDGANHDTGLVKLPGYPKVVQGAAAKSLRLSSILPELGNTEIILDFDKQGRLISVEFLL